MPDRSLFCGVAPSGLILTAAPCWSQKGSQRADDLQEREQQAARLPRLSQQRVATRSALEGMGSSRPCRLLTAGVRAGPFELATNRRASQCCSVSCLLHSSITASSTSITGMSSRIGYTRLHCVHFSPLPSGFNSTFTLQTGQASISRSLSLTGIWRLLLLRRQV